MAGTRDRLIIDCRKGLVSSRSHLDPPRVRSFIRKPPLGRLVYSAALRGGRPDRMQLHADADALRPAYQGAHPFPHPPIHVPFADPPLDAVLADLPRPDEDAWRRFESATEKKLGWVPTAPLRPNLREFLVAMNAPPMLQFLQQLTGIDGLISDPYYRGGGPQPH